MYVRTDPGGQTTIPTLFVECRVLSRPLPVAMEVKEMRPMALRHCPIDVLQNQNYYVLQHVLQNK